MHGFDDHEVIYLNKAIYSVKCIKSFKKSPFLLQYIFEGKKNK